VSLVCRGCGEHGNPQVIEEYGIVGGEGWCHAGGCGNSSLADELRQRPDMISGFRNMSDGEGFCWRRIQLALVKGILLALVKGILLAKDSQSFKFAKQAPPPRPEESA
jgi:hypothetical protein